MATRKSQRIFIWIITVVMIVGTVFSFVVMILGSKNSQADQARINALSAQYQKDTEAYQKKVEAQTKKLSDTYYKDFSHYASLPKAFASNDVKKLVAKDLKVGTGATINKDSKIAMYYIGWNPKGKTFDSSVDGKKLKQPLIREGQGNWIFGGGQQGGVIEGWEDGIIGMKVGGVRELTIPADKAYGKQGQGEDIPANTPLKFIIMAIPHVTPPASPQMPAELLQYYQSIYGAQQ